MSQTIRQNSSIASEGRSIFSLDLVRAYAIFAIVAEHALNVNDLGDLRAVLRFTLFPGATLFFILSGALLLPVEGSYRKFLRHRAARVLIPFFVWSLVYPLLGYAFGDIDGDYCLHQLKWAWLKPTFLEGWFVPVMFSLYLFMPVISPWIRSASRRHLEYFMALWIAAGIIPWLYQGVGIDCFHNYLSSFVSYVGYIVAGYYLIHYPVRTNLIAQGVDQHASTRRRNAALIVCAITLGIVLPATAYFIHRTPSVAFTVEYDFSASVMAVNCLLFMIFASINTLGRHLDAVVRFIARNSYGIFLSSAAVSQFVVRPLLPDIYATSWRLPVVFAAAALLSWLLGKIPYIGHRIV